ncbi:hypothetical protein MC7420_3250 [Coleofasciculus chthonoplastes PCC 7420]|uniref:Uncharacterized protein n=1 Tax=Coleofasciculus chthonoplastes PCC 7420 TaxID=118168 RepID=B4VYV2_9CYAN|nr:hypothetical protein MC7420_3250 [Coleofasciculus chthonoplastes PCC 7420]
MRRGGFRESLVAIDDNVCAKPALTKCVRAGFTTIVFDLTQMYSNRHSG